MECKKYLFIRYFIDSNLRHYGTSRIQTTSLKIRSLNHPKLGGVSFPLTESQYYIVFSADEYSTFIVVFCYTMCTLVDTLSVSAAHSQHPHPSCIIYRAKGCGYCFTVRRAAPQLWRAGHVCTQRLDFTVGLTHKQNTRAWYGSDMER